MRSRHQRKTPLLLLLLAIAPLHAAGPADETAVAGPRDVPDRIEYQALPLSEDVYKRQGQYRAQGVRRRDRVDAGDRHRQPQQREQPQQLA